MSSRKRTKRKNSDEDFDVDDEDDGLDNDDTNKWACHSCTFMNRAAAYRCFVCGTRKGTSTRKSRVNDNVVEMQKTITTMVQKQVEKEKSMKRRERSLINSVPRETSRDPESEISLEIKQELLNAESDECQKSTSSTPLPILRKVSTPEIRKTPVPTTPEAKSSKPVQKETQSSKRKYSKSTEQKTPSPSKKKMEKVNRSDTNTLPNGPAIKMEFIQIEDTEPSRESLTMNNPSSFQQCSSKTRIAQNSIQPHEMKLENPTILIKLEPPSAVPSSSSVSNPTVTVPQPHESSETSILQHLPERVVKKLNQPNTMDSTLLSVHKRLTGIDPIVAESETVLLPQDWNRQRVMRGLSQCGNVGFHTSPTTSRQSSETDSSSSEANRSIDVPFNEKSPRPTKSYQIPDYMIHRESPQKIFIVANGFPAYFEEFPRRIPPAYP